MDALCVGHAAWDISLFVDEFPSENSKCEIHTMLEGGGGPAANAAFLLSRWGMPSAFAGSVGADAYGDRIAQEFAAAGTDITMLHRSATTPTPISVILVNERNGSRTIINRKAPRTGKPLRLTPRPAWPEPPRVLLFDGHELKASLEAMALFPQARTILDAGSLRDGTRELAGRVDYLVSSERFARQFSNATDLDTALGALYRCNGKPVVITCGERGVIYGTGERIERLQALPVEVRDTTGAGDIFHGAFVYGILKDFSLSDAVRLAITAASLSVSVCGGRPSIPSLKQVQERLCHAG
jgi:sugar/nucleoside kinase (ribokinase family)